MRLIVLLFIIIVFPATAQKFNPEITVIELKDDVGYLASDELKGRKSGEAGDLLAAEYIRTKFKNAGLELMYDKGFQKFSLVTSAEIGEGNKLNVNGNIFEVEKHFLPFAFSANTSVSAEIVFAGYGLEVDKDTLQWNDYKDVDVSGKWVLALQGDPDLENPQSPFIEYSSERSKALFASDRNAAGLIIVAGKKFSETDRLTSLIFDKNSARYSIPVIQVTREVANKMLGSNKMTIEKLEAEMDSLNRTLNLQPDAKVSVTVNVNQKETETQNVVALLRGTDINLKNEYVVVGAHFDHLGMGGPGSGSRVTDTIAVHNGADDNASGVAAIIQLC
jgi:aminopeptidase YwaD